MRNKAFLRASLESRIEDVIASTPVEVITVAEPEATLAADSVVIIDTSDVELEAVQRAQDDTVDTVDAIDQLTAAAAQLSDVRSNIEATIPNGGLTPGEAVAYATATNVITADLGVTEVMPAMENFGGSMSRLQATQESLTAITDVIKRVAARAMELVEELLKRIAKLAVRIVDYLTSDKSRLKKFEGILSGASGNKTVSVTVAGDVAALLGLSGNSAFSPGDITKQLGFLALTSDAAVVSVTTDIGEVFDHDASAMKTILVGSTSTNGNKVSTAKINGVQIIETLPRDKADFDTYDIELVQPDVSDSASEVTLTVANLQAMVKLINSVDSSLFRQTASKAEAAMSTAKFTAWATSKFSDDEVNVVMQQWRHLSVTRGGIAPQLLGLYNRIIQGMFSVLAKGTAAVAKTSDKPAGLPNKA